jgi:hypothetical protein
MPNVMIVGKYMLSKNRVTISMARPVFQLCVMLAALNAITPER